MAQIWSWIVGAALTILGLFGLLIASRTEAETMYWAGIGIFVACVLIVFGLIKEAYDRH